MRLQPARARRSMARSASGPSGDVLEIGGLDLVAEFLLDLQAALVVLIGPAEVADRADIDEAGLELVLAPGRPTARATAARRRQCE